MAILNHIFRPKLTKEQYDLLIALKNILGIKTENVYVYELAFKHKSLTKTSKSLYKDTYERLEFLGDSILGAVVAEYLFKKYPFKSEGFLTNLRSKIVCGKFLSKISQKMGLNKLICISNNNTISNSTLEDVLEALIGAVFIDKGFEYTKKMIIERIINIHINVEELADTETNFKSRLIEWAQKEKKELKFVLKDSKIVNSKNQYVVEVAIDGENFPEATNYSIKESEQLASEKAIEILKETLRY